MQVKRAFTLCVCLVLLLTMGGGIFLSAFVVRADAAQIDITTSSVRDDLASMEKDKLSYLSSQENIFISMAQYYENEDTLRTYVFFNYIGSFDTDLTISVSTAEMDENFNITDKAETYKLAFVNNDSTWVKYEVLGLPNLDKVTRRYKLEGIFSSSGVILNIDEVFIFHGITNETIEVFHQEVETITITEKDVQFFCYGEESKWNDFFGVDGTLGHNKKYTDAWYIFFNTDKPMDSLKEIEITYFPYDYQVEFLGLCNMSYEITEERIQEHESEENQLFDWVVDYGEQEIITVTPGTTKVSASDNWWAGYKTTYQEIDNIVDLRKYEAVNEDGNPFVFTEQAKKYTWAVNFLNTEKASEWGSVSMMGNPVTTVKIDGTGVRNTAILRIKYEINGVVKNAYAIDIPTDDFTGNVAQVDIENQDWWQKLMSVLMLVLLVALLGPFLTPLLSVLIKVVWFAVKTALSAVVWAFGFPFRLLGRLFRTK